METSYKGSTTLLDSEIMNIDYLKQKETEGSRSKIAAGVIDIISTILAVVVVVNNRNSHLDFTFMICVLFIVALPRVLAFILYYFD